MVAGGPCRAGDGLCAPGRPIGRGRLRAEVQALVPGTRGGEQCEEWACLLTRITEVASSCPECGKYHSPAESWVQTQRALGDTRRG